MRFSVITPSFRNSNWLKLCVPSVADQAVEVEHIVQDSCSDDGTQDWLPKDPRVRAFIEKDQGMYDAINQGMLRAKGDILSYLNCDEQYLPGALQRVQNYFQEHPEVEIVFGDAIVVDANGDYLCHRQACLPRKYHTLVSANLAVMTCATFFRRSLIDQRGLFYDPALKAVSDAAWVFRLLENKINMGLLQEFTSTFTETGTNLCLLDNAQREQREMFRSAPPWARFGKHLIIAHHRLRRFFAGHYKRRPPFGYGIYTSQNPNARVIKYAAKPTFVWRRSIPLAVNPDVSLSQSSTSV